MGNKSCQTAKNKKNSQREDDSKACRDALDHAHVERQPAHRAKAVTDDDDDDDDSQPVNKEITEFSGLEDLHITMCVESEPRSLGHVFAAILCWVRPSHTVGCLTRYRWR